MLCWCAIKHLSDVRPPLRRKYYDKCAYYVLKLKTGNRSDATRPDPLQSTQIADPMTWLIINTAS